MDSHSSDSLLRRWQVDGDPRALGELLRTELPKLRRRLRVDDAGLLGTSVGATDAAQEAAHRLIERESELSFHGIAPLRAFLWTTARRYLIDRFRRRQRRRPLEEPELVVDARDASHEERDPAGIAEIWSAMRALAFGDREILELVYVHQRSLEEAAGELGIQKSAARMRLSRAEERLRDLLEVRKRAST
ncbi:MAG: RNA polymerase sigma factor [Planctomycetota bacterium]